MKSLGIPKYILVFMVLFFIGGVVAGIFLQIYFDKKNCDPCVMYPTFEDGTIICQREPYTPVYEANFEQMEKIDIDEELERVF